MACALAIDAESIDAKLDDAKQVKPILEALREEQVADRDGADRMPGRVNLELDDESHRSDHVVRARTFASGRSLISAMNPSRETIGGHARGKLGAVLYAEFGEHVSQVSFDRLYADEQTCRDFAVAEAIGHEGGDRVFAGRQRRRGVLPSAWTQTARRKLRLGSRTVRASVEGVEHLEGVLEIPRGGAALTSAT
jgi:hypothetical protein